LQKSCKILSKKRVDLEEPHIPVLLQEVVDTFADIKEGAIIDCTLGYAGHSSAILKTNLNVSIIGIDQDITAIEYSTKRLQAFGNRVKIVQGSFGKKITEVLQMDGEFKTSGVLADIGVSSLQLDSSERGFGFSDDILDMRMNQSQTLSAKEVINSYSQAELERIFREYGEVQAWRKAASAIVEYRAKKEIESAKELSSIVSKFGKRGSKIHPSTLIFQAIRIEVNDELGQLNALLDSLQNLAPSGCRVAIISFHSLEDRIVKQRFKSWEKSCICDSRAMRCTCGNNHAKGKVVTKKPITATQDELRINARSRSAKMRVFDFGV